MGEGKVANEAILGIAMQSQSGATVTGKWQWVPTDGVTDYEWCNVGSYELKAQFVPAQDFAANYATYEETFTVSVVKATPTITGDLVYAMKQTEEYAPGKSVARLPLAIAELKSDTTVAKNPNAGFAGANGKVQGSWQWDDRLLIPSPNESNHVYKVWFIPKDAANYNSVSYEATVNLTVFYDVPVYSYTRESMSGVGYSTGNSYQFESYGKYGFATYNSAATSISMGWDRYTGWMHTFFEQTFGSYTSGVNVKQVIPLGVFING